jgi:hypothetical protein
MENQKASEDIKVNKIDRIRFSISFFIFALLWMSGLAIVSAVLLPQHLKNLVGASSATAVYGVFKRSNSCSILSSKSTFWEFF